MGNLQYELCKLGKSSFKTKQKSTKQAWSQVFYLKTEGIDIIWIERESGENIERDWPDGGSGGGNGVVATEEMWGREDQVR